MKRTESSESVKRAESSIKRTESTESSVHIKCSKPGKQHLKQKSFKDSFQKSFKESFNKREPLEASTAKGLELRFFWLELSEF